MPRLGDIQRAFAAAILGADRRAVPVGVIGRADERAERRFDVYRNNVHAGLVEALLVTFPVTARLVGEAFFRAMARAYVSVQLPQTPVLIDYGAGFPNFIDAFEPAADLPYLGDVARLEWAWSRAYHAADAPVMAIGELMALPPERLESVRLVAHPAARLVVSAFPIVAIWRTNTEDAKVQPVDLAVAETALVTRPAYEVEIRRLAGTAPDFVAAVLAGATLVQAATAAVARDPEFDLAVHLAGLFSAGAVTAIASGRDRGG